jgi:hypothetical protein
VSWFRLSAFPRWCAYDSGRPWNQTQGGGDRDQIQTNSFPTDFSPAAIHALDYAISLALEHEATLVLVHVIEDIGFASPFTLSSFPVNLEYQHGMDAQAKAELHKAVAPQLKRQLQVEERLAQGKPLSKSGGLRGRRPWT